MTEAPPTAVLHIGVCTSDLERSLRFYTEALGFTVKRYVDELGAPFDTLMELPGARLHGYQIECGGVSFELMSFTNRETVGPVERRPMNQLGMTHITLLVDDPQATGERVEKCGGKVHRETEIDTPYGPIVFCTDPDGVRIELMRPFQ